jgi:hypothetical protein
VAVGVLVFAGVAVSVRVAVAVRVDVGVLVGVTVAVFVAVLVGGGVFVGRGRGVLVGPVPNTRGTWMTRRQLARKSKTPSYASVRTR